MTEKLFLDDPRLCTARATVLASGPDGIVLDRTVFYARSGGQPGDVGVLRWDGGQTPIVDTVKGDGETLILRREKAASQGKAPYIFWVEAKADAAPTG